MRFMRLPITYSNIVNTLLFLFTIGILNLKILGDFILLLFMLMGIYTVFTDKINPFKQRPSKSEDKDH